jgi:hypothetical protein
MNGFTVTKHGRSRFWALRDGAGDLVCLCVYKRGALEVARRLAQDLTPDACCLREAPAPFASKSPESTTTHPQNRMALK